MAVIAVLAITAAACGDDEEAQTLPTVGSDVASACAEGTVDCNDTVDLQEGDEPIGEEPADAGGFVVDGGLSISEALESDATGIIAVHGFLVADAEGARLCEALAESFPPQCGGVSVPLTDLSAIDPDEIKTSQGVSWTDFSVVILGEIVDGSLVPTPASL